MASYQGTFETITQSVIDKLRLDETDDLARTKEWVNLAYLDVAQRTGFVQTFETVAGADTTGFEICSDTGWITQLFVDGVLAQHVTLEEVIRQRASGSSATGPLYALAGGTRVEVYPDPSAATVDVWQSDLVDELVNDADEPVIPEPFGSKLLEAGALVEGARFKKDPLLQDYEASFASWLEQFVTWASKRLPVEPMRLRLRLPLTTFGGLQSSVADQLGLDSFDEERVKSWLNRAYMTAVQQTGCLQTEGAATLTSGTSGYTLPTPVAWLQLMTVTYADGTFSDPLRQVTLAEILDLRRATFAGGQAVIEPLYAVVGLDRVELWPEPGTGQTLNFWYTYLPDELVTDDDAPVIMEPFGSKLLEYGALVEGARYKKDPLLTQFQADYAAEMTRFQHWLTRREGMAPLTFRVRGANRPLRLADRSADYGGYGW